MKISEAMRLGALLRPQAFGDLRVSKRRWFRRVESTCAFGAAMEAAGLKAKPIEATALGNGPRGKGLATVQIVVPETWSCLLLTSACPVCASVDTVIRLIAHLNDEHRWTRERIADWVATIEPQDDTPCDHGKHATLAAQ